MKMMTIGDVSQTSCPIGRDVLDAPPPEISAALKVFSGKWTLMILCQLSKRVARFNELKRTIPGITQHMLTASLRELEANGIVQRTVYAEVPPRVEYRMTPHGRSLKPVIEALADWGRLHLKQQAARKTVIDRA
jgi:DNA-binding HxlR family transcriptional regulator